MHKRDRSTVIKAMSAVRCSLSWLFCHCTVSESKYQLKDYNKQGVKHTGVPYLADIFYVHAMMMMIIIVNS